MIIVNTDNMRIVGGMNTKSISFDVDDIPVEVDFEENIITIGNTDYECHVCHATHDRDINASINILKEGKRLLSVV